MIGEITVRKKILWGIVLLAMVLSIPYLMERIDVEQEVETYETVIPYEDINSFTKDAGLDTQTVYERLTKDNQVQSVAFEPVTLNDMRDRDLITYITDRELVQLYGADPVDIPQERGIFLQILVENELTESIEEVMNYSLSKSQLEVETFDLDGEKFLYIPFASAETLRESVSFDMQAYEEAASYDIDIIIRVINDFQADQSEHLLYEQIREMSEDISHILFTGSEIPGGGDPEVQDHLARKINELDISVAIIENADQVGMNGLLEKVNHEPVRLHSLTLGKDYDPEDYTQVFRGERAVYERNIGILFINILNKDRREFYDRPEEAEEMLGNTEKYFQNLHGRVDGEQGVALPPAPFRLSLWMEVGVLLAAGAFTGIVSSLAGAFLIIPAALISFVIYLGIFIVQNDLLMKLVVLLLALLAPVYAILKINRPKSLAQAAKIFLEAAGIALTGGWFVIMLLYGTDFLIGLDSFRGVKVLSTAPLAITGIVFFGWRWLREPVKFWHLAVMGVLGGLILFYITRTGNTGATIPYELVFRQWLENTFSARPRTTEFLIGLPIFTLGLYLWKEKVKYAWFLLLGGSLAFSSIVGTFTHLHTPLLISIIRTFLSLSLGLSIGIILILIYEGIKKWIYPFITKRRLQ
jgi:hypothetical protein